MNRRTIVISALLMINLSGCAYYLPLSPEERIANYKEDCARMGFEMNSSENANCVLELEKSYRSRSSNSVRNNNGRIQEMIDNDRIQRQILNHGAGGCTPNFATGGCL